MEGIKVVTFVILGMMVALIILLVASTGNTPRCLRGHDEMMLMPVYIDKTVYMLPQTYFVCDEREE